MEGCAVDGPQISPDCPASAALRQEALTLALYMAGMVVCFGLCVGISPAGLAGKARLDFAACLLWLPLTPIMLICAATAVVQLGGSVEDRMYGEIPAVVLFGHLYISAQIVGICIELPGRWDRGKIMTVAHHVLSIAGFACPLFLTRRFLFYNGITGAGLVAGAASRRQSKTALADWMNANLQPLLALNGLCLWLSFIVFRLLLFPVVICLFVSDMVEIGPEGRGELLMLELCFYPTAVVLLLVLSVVWFTKIHAGMLKALRSKAGGEPQARPLKARTGLAPEFVLQTRGLSAPPRPAPEFVLQTRGLANRDDQAMGVEDEPDKPRETWAAAAKAAEEEAAAKAAEEEAAAKAAEEEAAAKAAEEEAAAKAAEEAAAAKAAEEQPSADRSRNMKEKTARMKEMTKRQYMKQKLAEGASSPSEEALMRRLQLSQSRSPTSSPP